MMAVARGSEGRSQASTPYCLTGFSITVVPLHLSSLFLMGTVRRILSFAFAVNLLLNVLFLIHTGILRLPYLSAVASKQLTLYNAHKGPYAQTSWTTQQPLEPISFSMVMYGESSAKEGLLALKTVLMHISRPAEFHIICSPDAIPIIQSKLDLFSR